MKMTQIFDDSGRVHPATLVVAGPVEVAQIKLKEGRDKYDAVKVKFGAVSREFAGKGEFELGQKIDASTFQVGDVVRVSGISKGKGFAGVVKRHGFRGGSRTHGQKHSEREPGSIGVGGVQRVFKGTRMGGRMGGTRITVKNLKVLAIDTERGEMLISGAVPGRRGTFLEIRSVK